MMNAIDLLETEHLGARKDIQGVIGAKGTESHEKILALGSRLATAKAHELKPA